MYMMSPEAGVVVVVLFVITISVIWFDRKTN